jgi:hypothetical protein
VISRRSDFNGLKRRGYAVILVSNADGAVSRGALARRSSGAVAISGREAPRAGGGGAGVSEWGEIVYEKTLWPLVFTQRLMVERTVP